MKKLFTLLTAVIIAATVFSQAPSKFSYQAVIRNSGGVLVQSQAVGIKISILQGSAIGSAVYAETHTITTNSNGLVTLEIGSGSVFSGNFGSIDWSNGPYFLLTETDPTGGTSYTISGSSELVSVPYALYAKNAETADYNNLSNLPALFNGAYSSLTGTPVIPTTTSQLTNNSGFLTSYTETDPVFSGFINITSPANNQLLKYNSVSGKWENWTSNFLTGFTETDPLWTSASLNYYTKSQTDVLIAGHAHDDASTTVSGFMSGTDKTKLDGLTNADGSETVVTSGTNVSVTGSGTTGSPYIINAAGSNGWNLTGNAGTVDGTNFIGTTDGAPFNIRVNNQKAGRIDPALFNSFYGLLAGNSNTTGSANVAIGSGALRSNTIGAGNTASGTNALYSNTEGQGNTATGSSALNSNTTGNRNTATGLLALRANTTGYYNTATGYAALYSQTTGFENTAYGYQALNNLTTSYRNTATGFQSLYSNTGYDNAGFGYQALADNTTGVSNTATGSNSNRFNTTGSANTSAGYSSLYSNTQGYSNTAIGYQTLYTNTTGNSNTALGYDADVSTGALTNATAIGAGSIVNTSNSVQLGNSSVTKVYAGTGNTATLIAGGLQMTGGMPGVGKVLTSDASGVASWTAPAAGVNADWNAVSGASEILNKPVLAIVATTGSYTDLTNTPVVDGSETKVQSGANVSVTGSGTTGSPYIINAAGSSGWGLTGNAGTVNGINFIGTTDNVPLNFRVNGQVAGKIFPANNDTYFGYQTGLANTTGNGNTGFGHQVLISNTSGNDNVASGYHALRYNTTGSSNSAYGTIAHFSNTSGSNNTAIGNAALYSNTTGNSNTALGNYADVSTGSLTNATAIGASAIVTASNSIQLGDAAVTQVFAGTGTTATLIAGGLQIKGGTPAAGKVLTSDATGVATWQAAGGGGGWSLTGNAGTVDGTNFIGTTDNIALNFRVNNQKAGRIDGAQQVTFYGYQAGNSNSTSTNSAFGYQALYTNTSGGNNTAIGRMSMMYNTTGGSNTVMGNLALLSNTTGDNNVAIGDNSAVSNSTGRYNIAIGSFALNSNWVGSYATAIGARAMYYSNSTMTPFTNFNVAVGFEALRGSTNAAANTGNANTVVGYQSMLSNTTGVDNTASGFSSLFSNTTGNLNTSYGSVALYSNATGSRNTAIGTSALINATMNDNTALGRGAGSNITIGSNNIAIGSNAQVPTPNASNQVRIGDANITYAGIQVAWTVTSDKRFKSDIQESNLGLDFITSLKPVSYSRINDVSKKREYGLIAQDLEESLSMSGATNNGIIAKDDEGMYSVRYNDLMAPMIKAIQEQQQLIKSLQEEIGQLKGQNEQKQSILSILEVENAAIKSDLENRLKVLEELIAKTAQK